MLIKCKPRRESEQGYALLMTLCMLAVMLVFLASVMSRSATESKLTFRNNTYNSCLAAAEADTEMVMAQMDRDFLFQSVNSDLNVYRAVTVDPLQTNWPVQFEFSDGTGTVNKTGLISLGPAVVTNLTSQFAGLYGLVSSYRVTSQARALNRYNSVAAAVSQEFELASIPVFQFAIFYAVDLEINPGAAMTVNGKVHSNGNIWSAPPANLSYLDDVGAALKIIPHRNPNDPQPDGGGAVTYNKTHVNNAGALTLPIGTANDPSSVEQILAPPPSGEDPNSEMGKQRYYNKSDLIIQTTSGGIKVMTGLWNNFSVISPDVTNSGVAGYSFVKTSTKMMFDIRENQWTATTQIDVAAFNAWLKAAGAGINSTAQYQLGHELDSIYVDDQRSMASRLTTVRVVNGSALPPDGLTIATQLPLYVMGHYNLNNGDTTPGQTDTSNTKPASLAGDSITILSQNWDDSNAGKSVTQRGAVNTTVNAAFIGGIVASAKDNNGTKHYSGGVENFPRLLEDWSGDTLTYNGSMVVMFYSKYAMGFWVTPGTGNGQYYTAPTRKWSFDVNFLNQAKLPPGTPQVRKLLRTQWAVQAVH